MRVNLRSGDAGVAGAGCVLAAVLVASPLYLASVGSAALQIQYGERCPGRIGLLLPSIAHSSADVVREAVAQRIDGAEGLGAVEMTLTFEPIVVEGIGDVRAEVRLLHRDDGANVRIIERTTDAGLSVPSDWAAAHRLGVGSTLQLRDGTERFTVPIAATYEGMTGVRTPPRWCTVSDVLRPSPLGDSPPPLLLLDDASFAGLPAAVRDGMLSRLELHVPRSGLTLPIASSLQRRLDAAGLSAIAAVSEHLGVPATWLSAESSLPAVVNRAEGIRSLALANLRPVAVAGAVAAVGLAAVAGLFAARRHQDELTTRAIRGEGPLRLAGRLAMSAALPAALGAAVGGAGVVPVVALAGPSRDLGRVAGAVTALSMVAGVVVVVVAAASAARVVANLADPRPVRWHRRRLLTLLPWELAPLGLVILSWRRLIDVGGAQLIGSEAVRVDALALGFPVLVAFAAALVCIRPVLAGAVRLRRFRPHAPPSILLASRRLSLDPASAAAVMAAVTIAAATTVLGGALSATAERALAEKARVFVGADVAVSIAGSTRSVPGALRGRATVADEYRTSSGDHRVTILGIDPVTFAEGASLSDADAALVRELAEAPSEPGEPVPAIVVGPLPETQLAIGSTGALHVAPIARPSVFPRSRTTSTLVVVDAADVDSPQRRTILLAHGDRSAVEENLAGAGIRVVGIHTLAETASESSRSAVRWAYGALRALGLVVVIVLMGVQLARNATRVRLRRLAEVLTETMGLERRGAMAADALELGLPLSLGVVVGVGVALVAAGVAGPELDSAAILPPRAQPVVPAGSVIVVVTAAIGIFVVVLWSARRQARRIRAAVVLRE